MRLFVKGVLICSLIVSACSKKDDDEATVAQITVPNLAEVAGLILPDPSATSAALAVPDTSSWCADNVSNLVCDIYKLFTDPENWPTDIGVENIRANLELVGMLAEKTTKEAAETTDEDFGEMTFTVETGAKTAVSEAIAPPFGSEVSSDYTAAIDDIPNGLIYQWGRATHVDFTGAELVGGGSEMDLQTAWRNVAPKFSMLTTQYAESETSLFEGEYTETEGDLRLNRACYSTDGEGKYFIMRINLDGNKEAKTFKLRVLKRGRDLMGETFGTKILSIVGAGVSEKINDGDHYILKIKNSDTASSTEGLATQYFCIASDVEVDDFASFYNNGGAFANNTKVQKVTDPDSFTGICKDSEHVATVDEITMWDENDAPAERDAFGYDLGFEL